MSLAGPNCWTLMHAKFVAALTASATFRAMVGLTSEATDAAVAGFLFGNRMTHDKAGRVWKPEELLELNHYGQLFDHPDQPYGKHPAPEMNRVYRPHGTVIIGLHRLVAEADLVTDDTGRKHTTDAHDDDWRAIVGSVLSEVIDWCLDFGGPQIGQTEVIDVWVTATERHKTQGCFQHAEIVFPWSEN